MTINEAKEKIQSRLDAAKAQLGSLGVKLDDEIQQTTNDTPEGTETVFLFGALAIYTDSTEDDDTLLLPIEAELDGDGGVVDASLECEMARFDEKIQSVKERLTGADDATATVKELSHEIDDEIERRYQEKLARMNAVMKRNIRTALIAAAALAVVAVIFVIIGKL